VKPTGWRGWCYITRVNGKRREIGLGAFPAVSLADARAAAARIRLAVADGADPMAAKPSRAVEAAPKLTTFGEAADEFVASMEAGWRNEKHRQQWRSTLATHAASLRDKPVAHVGTDDVLAVLQPIWTTKAETASRLRGRIERILDFAAVKGWRDRGVNPAAWKGNLALTLPAAGKLKRGHHGAMPYADVPAFMGELAGRRGIAALALRFVVLTAARSGEVRGMTWGEVSDDVWRIPAERMKGGREHRVPLTAPAMAVLEAMAKLGDAPDRLVFPGTKPGKPMSDMTLTAVLKRMKREDVTVHGFRSSFSTWTADCTDASIEVREAALAHAAGDKVAAAYNRSDHFARRRELMEQWAEFITKR